MKAQPSNTDLRQSEIYLSLVFKSSNRDLRFCMRHDLLPPKHWKRGQIARWVAEARASEAHARARRRL